MCWRCQRCKRFWGRRHAECPRCESWLERDMALRRVLPGVEMREFIHAYEDAPLRLTALPSGQSLCGFGGNLNCRCHRCIGNGVSGQDPVLHNISVKSGHFHRGRLRAKAARWVYLLSGMVSARRGHGALEGLLLAVRCGRGAHAQFLNFYLRRVFINTPRECATRWITALFMQYVDDRSDVRGLTGTAAASRAGVEFQSW